MASHLRLTGCSLFACALLLSPIPAKTAPVLALTASSVTFGEGSRTNDVNISGADFHFAAVISGGGFGYAPAQFGQNLGYQNVNFSNSTGPVNYAYYDASINYDGVSYFARFSGNASASSTAPAFAPYDSGSVVVPASVQGSLIACLVTISQNPYAPCDASLPTYTLSFQLPGYIQLDEVNEGAQLHLDSISAHAPVPEPSSFILLFAGLVSLLLPIRRIRANAKSVNPF